MKGKTMIYPELEEAKTEHAPWLIVLIIIVAHRIYSGPYLFPLPRLISQVIGVAVFLAGIVVMSVVKSYQAKSDENIWKKGAYKHVRHPVYASLVLMLLGLSFLMQHFFMLLFTFSTFLVLYRQAENEEKELLEMYPEEYGDYMEKVKKRFIPGIL